MFQVKIDSSHVFCQYLEKKLVILEESWIQIYEISDNIKHLVPSLQICADSSPISLQIDLQFFFHLYS